MSAQDGGTAFPVPMVSDGNVVGDVNERGMSLRDYFAGQALTGIIASYTGADLPLPTTYIASASAYDFADAMLKERERAK